MRTNTIANMPSAADIEQALATLSAAMNGVLAQARTCSRTNGVELAVKPGKGADIRLTVDGQALYKFGQFDDAMAFFREEVMPFARSVRN